LKRILRYQKLAAIFLAIPVICYFVLGWAMSDMDAAWNQALQKNNIAPDRIPALVIVCQNSSTVTELKLGPICAPYTNGELFRKFALLTAVGTVSFVLLVMVAGLVSKANRHLLLRLFRPGFVISNLVVATLLILQAILISETIRCSSWNSTDQADVYFYFALFGVIALVGVFLTVKPLFGTGRKAQSTVIGQTLSAADYPALWKFVNDLAKTVGSDVPHNLVVGLTPAFFVTEADVHCIGGTVTGRTMYLSVPLCRILTVEELSAVIAHELGHFRGEDTVFSLHFYPIYRGVVDSLNGVSEAVTSINNFTRCIPINAVKIIGVIGSLTLFPSIYMISYFLECFSGAENAISRDREISADAVAAKTSGAANIATALAKLYAYTGMWDQLSAVMRDGLSVGYVNVGDERYDARQFFSNVSELYAITVAQCAEPKSLDGLDARTIPHPTDSHPPLSVRLDALGQSLTGIRSSALNVSPIPPAHEVIDNCNDLEGQLSMVEQALVTSR
jgi:Zn-dependent protease with chaperone function